MGLVGSKSKNDIFKCPTEHYQRGKDVLTTKEDRELLQSIATSRDEMNKGMTSKEMISSMSKLLSVSSKAAENHFEMGWLCCVSSSDNNKPYCNNYSEVALDLQYNTFSLGQAGQVQWVE